MKIKKREVILSLAIIAVMFILGFLISGKIEDAQNDKNAIYNKAVHIDNTELFQYGMDTNVGNAFVYGELNAIDTVSFDEIGGQYMYIKKVEEHYNRHTRIVTTTVNGKTQTRIEVYYSWDYYDSWSKHSEKISFCGIEFDYEKIDIPFAYYITTIKKSSNVRYVYYVVDIKYIGTIYTSLFDGTISDNSRFFNNMNIEDALDSCVWTCWTITFWGLWILLTIGIVIGFCYLDNRWLD